MYYDKKLCYSTMVHAVFITQRENAELTVNKIEEFINKLGSIVEWHFQSILLSSIYIYRYMASKVRISYFFTLGYINCTSTAFYLYIFYMFYIYFCILSVKATGRYLFLERCFVHFSYYISSYY